MKQLNRQQIESIVSKLDLVPAIENGFKQYSQGNVVVPPVGELLLEKGEVHIKYGYVKADDYYVIKIASGIQARLQAIYLKEILDCRQVVVWGRCRTKLAQYQNDMARHGFSVTLADSAEELAKQANLIVTTTPATSPMLKAEHIRSGTHITAMGSDTREKQELDAKILAKADLLVADSVEQCQQRGEIFHALTSGTIAQGDVLELGDVIAHGAGRSNDNQITVADLTGVAVQDIKIAEAVYRAHGRGQ